MNVLFITGKLQHYRIPILNIVSNNENIDLTVAHSGIKTEKKLLNFKEVILKEKKLGPFTKHDSNFLSFCNSFDVVVAMFYLQKLSFMRLLLKRNRNYKLIYWGIGVKASYKSKFDSPTVLNKARYYVARKSDAMIFYTDYAKEKYISKGIPSEKLFVMQNTVEVKERVKDNIEKKNLIFVGTINKSKKIFYLLEAYLNIHKSKIELPLLDVVGGGSELYDVQKWVQSNNLTDKIIVHGPIYDEFQLEIIYKRSLLSISPGQAGLSVLTSFAYGVPFATHYDAITGGERLNIENNENGILFKSNLELEQILIDTSKNPYKYMKMGIRAKEFYKEKRSPNIMAQGFIDAVSFTKTI